MTTLKDVPLRIPDQWDPNWFRVFVVEYLAKADVRDAIGVGITITSDGNSVATLSTDASQTAYVQAHNNNPSSHTEAINAHRAEWDPHTQYATDIDLSTHVAAPDPHSQYALDTDLNAYVLEAPEDGLEYVRLDATWIPLSAMRLNDGTYLRLNDGSYLLGN